jgi:hypothetical protein
MSFLTAMPVLYDVGVNANPRKISLLDMPLETSQVTGSLNEQPKYQPVLPMSHAKYSGMSYAEYYNGGRAALQRLKQIVKEVEEEDEEWEAEELKRADEEWKAEELKIWKQIWVDVMAELLDTEAELQGEAPFTHNPWPYEEGDDEEDPFPDFPPSPLVFTRKPWPYN